jgi:hypothetical protein
MEILMIFIEKKLPPNKNNLLWKTTKTNFWRLKIEALQKREK